MTESAFEDDWVPPPPAPPKHASSAPSASKPRVVSSRGKATKQRPEVDEGDDEEEVVEVGGDEGVGQRGGARKVGAKARGGRGDDSEVEVIEEDAFTDDAVKQRRSAVVKNATRQSMVRSIVDYPKYVLPTIAHTQAAVESDDEAPAAVAAKPKPSVRSRRSAADMGDASQSSGELPDWAYDKWSAITANVISSYETLENPMNVDGEDGHTFTRALEKAVKDACPRIVYRLEKKRKDKVYTLVSLYLFYSASIPCLVVLLKLL